MSEQPDKDDVITGQVPVRDGLSVCAECGVELDGDDTRPVCGECEAPKFPETDRR